MNIYIWLPSLIIAGVAAGVYAAYCWHRYCYKEDVRDALFCEENFDADDCDMYYCIGLAPEEAARRME